tara:strand:- start:591 stop:839 length:249 start_codon:yes stop_codon:yes gene_type:complete
MNDIQRFRMHMAEKGYEYTPEEAEQLMLNANNLIKILSTYTVPELIVLSKMLESDRESAKDDLKISDKDLDDIIMLIRLFYD